MRDDENAAGGLLLGMVLTALIALGVGAYYFLNAANRTPATFGPVTIPQTSPAPNQLPQVQERVIERDRIVPVPVPQQQAPAPTAPAPNVNITVPSASERVPASPAPSQGGTSGTSDANQSAPPQ